MLHNKHLKSLSKHKHLLLQAASRPHLYKAQWLHKVLRQEVVEEELVAVELEEAEEVLQAEQEDLEEQPFHQ